MNPEPLTLVSKSAKTWILNPKPECLDPNPGPQARKSKTLNSGP
jgi:hypothetical protein